MANFTHSTETIAISEQHSSSSFRVTAISGALLAVMTAGSRAVLKLSTSLNGWPIRVLRALKQSSRHERPDREPEDREEPAVPVFYEALSDDGPFRRMSEAEARRLVKFAFCYYFVLAVGVLAAFIWH